MRKGNRFIRRGAAAVAVSLGLLSITGSSAGAAGADLPEILNGQADAAALNLLIQVPGTGELQAALAAAGIDTTGIADLNGLIPGLTIRQKISLTHGEVLRSIEQGVQDVASGWAAVALGDLVETAVESRCAGGNCSDSAESTATRVDLPLDLGHIILNSASSATTSLVDTRNATGLAQVHVSLESLLGEGAPLAAVGGVLNDLREVVNGTVRPVVNDVVDTLNETLTTVIPENIKQEIVDRVVTIGHVNEIPDLTKADLLNLTVLGATANVFPQTRGGVEGLLATSSAKVTDLEILKVPGLDAWASLGAIDLSTEAFANGVAGGAKAVANSTVVGADLGGLLGIDISSLDLKLLTDPEWLFDVISKDAEAAGALKPVVEQVAAAAKLVAQIAGIDVEIFGTQERAARNGMSAEAIAGSLKITVEPKILTESGIQKLLATPGTIPQLADSDFTTTGLRLALTLPESYAAVGLGTVLGAQPPPAVTGVGMSLLAAVMLLGGAVTIRRFALAR